MTIRRHLEFWLPVLFALGASGLLGCQPPRLEDYLSEENVASEGESESEAIVIALVDGEAVTLADVQRNITALSEPAQWLLDSPRVRQDFARGLVQRRMLANQALAEGFANDPTVAFLAARVSAQETLFRLTEEQFPAQRPTDEDVEAYYHAHPSWYQRGYEARLVVAVADQETATTLLRRANEVGGILPIGEREAAFGELVTEAGAVFYGENDDLAGFIDQDTISAAFGDAAAEFVVDQESLGEFFGPFEVADGWAVFLVTRLHTPIDSQLLEVELDIRQRLVQERFEVSTERVMQGLRDSASIAVEEGVYETLSALRRSPDNPGPSFEGLNRDELELILNYHPAPSEVIERYRVRPVDEGTGQGTSE